MKLLICGDSFGADWTIKYPNCQGWPQIISRKHHITNISQAGVGEYKILKQIQSQHINDFDKIIVCHTSPYRIHTIKHPHHFKDILHKNSDIVINDLYNLPKTAEVNCLKDYIKYHYDIEFYKDIHQLLVDKIINLVPNGIHLSIFNILDTRIKCFEELCVPNTVPNHMTAGSNQKVADYIENLLVDRKP